VKRVLVLAFLALIVGGIAASLMVRDPGYVLIVYDRLSFESSLWFALLALVVVYVVGRVAWALGARLFSSRTGLRGWNESRRARQAHEQTLRGVLLLAEGDWNAAREALIGAVARAELPLVNYVGAARAAAAIGDWASCDSLLAHAIESTPGATIGVRLEGAVLRAEHGRFEETRPVLEALHREAPRHPLVLRRLIACYRALGDWSALLGLADALKKSKSVTAEEADGILEEAAVGRLRSAPADAVAGAFEALPKTLKERTAVIAAYCVAVDPTGSVDHAESLVRRALSNRWDDALVDLYGRLRNADASRQTAAAEGWLKSHPENATLLLAAGRIALKRHDWPRARQHFEASLERAATPAVCGELSRLCLALGEHDQAAAYLSRALELGPVELPQLPLPESPQRGA
jgi:HemY protein